MGYMVVRGEETMRVFLDELAVLIIENCAVSLTGCLLSALTEKKVNVEIISEFLDLYINSKNLLNRIQSMMEKTALDEQHYKLFSEKALTGLFLRITRSNFLCGKSKFVFWNYRFHFSPARNANDAIHAAHKGRTLSSTLKFPL